VGGGGGGDALGYTLEPGIPVPEVPQALSAEEGKKALNRVLRSVVTALLGIKGINKQPLFGMFRQPVSKTLVPDYNKFVAPEDELWLDKMINTAKGSRYSSVAQFRADINRICRNAEAYNSPGGGSQGGPEIAALAQSMVTETERILQQKQPLLAEAEAAMRQEPVSMPAPEPEMEGWVACEACNQWRKVSVAYQERVEREDIQFVCNMLPDLDCSVISEFGVAQD